MKSLVITKLARVEAPAEDKADGILAFQLINFLCNFYGKEVRFRLDTKIMSDGRQVVIDGNGFIKAGYEIN